MARIVLCKKLGKELPGLASRPFPNELGQRIFESISQEAWKMWLEHFKMIMNEFRLSPADPRSSQILFQQAEQFFFGEGAQLPPDTAQRLSYVTENDQLPTGKNRRKV